MQNTRSSETVSHYVKTVWCEEPAGARAPLMNWLSTVRSAVTTALAIAGIVTATLIGGCRPVPRRVTYGPPVQRPIRAIWVTRWDYKSPADIAHVMDNCRAAGFNTVLFQVRGAGTVFYRSRIEPWADELGGRDPGFDPLAVACKEAHGRGMSLHAWVNVMPGWRGDRPPADPKQLYLAHPDWFWRDAAGRRQPLGWYSSLNPCYPEVRRYLVAVMREIVEHYPVDGLHLDYIRFPNEWNSSYRRWARVPDYPRDPRTLALFRRATGHTPDAAPRQWDAWRIGQVTRLVRDIRAMMRGVKPRACLSAAVGASPQEAKRRHFQDSRRWVAGGLLDAVYPMNYTEDMRTFSSRLEEWSGSSVRTASRPPRAVRRAELPIPVVMGVMLDRRDGSTVIEQINRVRRHGLNFAAFAYNSLFERLDPNGSPIRDEASSARAALRERVIPYLRRLRGRRLVDAPKQ